MAATLTLVPVPEAPRETPWEHVGQYLEERADGGAWEDPPSFDLLGRLQLLAADLETDRAYLEGVAEKLDSLIGEVVCEVRDAEARARREADDGR